MTPAKRDDDAGAEVLAAIRALWPPRLGLCAATSSQEAGRRSRFRRGRARVGRIVIVNAGMLARTMPLAEMTAERMRRTIDVNVMGALLTAREAAAAAGAGR